MLEVVKNSVITICKRSVTLPPICLQESHTNQWKYIKSEYYRLISYLNTTINAPLYDEHIIQLIIKTNELSTGNKVNPEIKVQTKKENNKIKSFVQPKIQTKQLSHFAELPDSSMIVENPTTDDFSNQMDDYLKIFEN